MKKKFIAGILMFLVLGSLGFSVFAPQNLGFAAPKKQITDKNILEFFKEGYNAYYYIDSSLDKNNIIKYKDKLYLKVEKNFKTKEEIKKYISTYYTERATNEFVERLSPTLIEGELCVLAGEAGDKPHINSAQIVDESIEDGYVTLQLKDKANETIFLRAYIIFENEIMKIDKWDVL